ncbi:hypothetical protein MFLAVUS_009493 [Mucor flavus]|uniref:Uncharacterized protein n=1 Tax=Mucor flavus TaxID=439312 RepID=A0ABP9ZA16_9FUNG
MKLWGEVLKLSVGDSSEPYVNWGETSTDTTAVVKRINNDNKPHTIGCKVDGRIVCKLSKVVDTCHVEAARASYSLDKIHSGSFKLAAESKCMTDDIAMSGKLKKQKAVVLQNMQIFGKQAEVCALKFVDRGLYVNRVKLDLPSCSKIFGRGDTDDDNSKYCSLEWMTGTFLPPTNKPALLPKQLLTSPTTLSKNRSLKRKLPEFYLDDDTKVTSKFNKKD